LALSLRPNVLFLDEPTNDLDLETIRLMEEFLSQWPGTLVVVSHDRTFLSRTTDRLVEVTVNGAVREVPGGIDAWIARTTGSPQPAAAPSNTSERPVATASSGAPSSAPLGRQVRDAEKEMTRLERKKTMLTTKIVSSSDHADQTKLGAELAVVLDELNAAEERWLSLIQ
jgi:ATP-binding cassette subfamily F protein uup